MKLTWRWDFLVFTEVALEPIAQLWPPHHQPLSRGSTILAWIRKTRIGYSLTEITFEPVRAGAGYVPIVVGCTCSLVLAWIRLTGPFRCSLTGVSGESVHAGACRGTVVTLGALAAVQAWAGIAARRRCSLAEIARKSFDTFATNVVAIGRADTAVKTGAGLASILAYRGAGIVTAAENQQAETENTENAG